MFPIELALRDLWNAAEEKLAHARSASERETALKIHGQAEELLWEHVYQHQEADQGYLQTESIVIAEADAEDEHRHRVSHAEIRAQILAIFAAVRASTITPENHRLAHAHLSSLITSHARQRTAELSLISSACALSAKIGRLHVEIKVAASLFSPHIAPSSLPLIGPLRSFLATRQLTYKQRHADELEAEFGLLVQKLKAVHVYRVVLEQRIREFVDWMGYYSVRLTAEEQHGLMDWKGKEFQVVMKGQGVAYSRFVITAEGRWLLT